jgi:hypothetical protein
VRAGVGGHDDGEIALGDEEELDELAVAGAAVADGPRTPPMSLMNQERPNASPRVLEGRGYGGVCMAARCGEGRTPAAAGVVCMAARYGEGRTPAAAGVVAIAGSTR